MLQDLKQHDKIVMLYLDCNTWSWRHREACMAVDLVGIFLTLHQSAEGESHNRYMSWTPVEKTNTVLLTMYVRRWQLIQGHYQRAFEMKSDIQSKGCERQVIWRNSACMSAKKLHNSYNSLKILLGLAKTTYLLHTFQTASRQLRYRKRLDILCDLKFLKTHKGKNSRAKELKQSTFLPAW